MATTYSVTRNSTILRDAIGVLWLTSAGTLAALGAVAMLSTSVSLTLISLAVVAIACLLLYPRELATLRAALRLPRESSPVIETARKQLSRRFGAVVGVELLLFLVANVVLLATNHYEFLVPTILLIVGVHFFPIAALFKLWPYNLTTGLFCLGAIIPLITTAHTLQIGRASSWIVIPTITCALSAWLTAGTMLSIQANRLCGSTENTTHTAF